MRSRLRLWHLAALVASGKPRADLEAILLTGIPTGIISGFTNFTGSVLADMLRLNTTIKPAAKPNVLGLLGGDPAGFPNGRRVTDDVVTIELRAIAGVTYPLVAPAYKPDAAAGEITDFTNDLVFYQPSAHGIEVLRVLHGAQDIDRILAEEFAISNDDNAAIKTD